MYATLVKLWGRKRVLNNFLEKVKAIQKMAIRKTMQVNFPFSPLPKKIEPY